MTGQERIYDLPFNTLINAVCDLAEASGFHMDQDADNPGGIDLLGMAGEDRVIYRIAVTAVRRGCAVWIRHTDPEKRYLIERLRVEDLFVSLERRLYERDPIRKTSSSAQEQKGESL